MATHGLASTYRHGCRSRMSVLVATAEDWNTNLPYTCGTEEIFEHIKHNKGDESIRDEDCIAAIRMIQDAITSTQAESEAAK